MGGDLLNVSRSCTTAISRPPASTRGDTEVARGRDVALCTVEAAFQTRPHATLRAMRTRGVGFLGYILYALHAKCRCCVCKNVGCVVLHGVTRAPPCGSHMVLPPRKCVSHPTYQGMGPVHQFFAGSQRAKASAGGNESYLEGHILVSYCTINGSR